MIETRYARWLVNPNARSGFCKLWILSLIHSFPLNFWLIKLAVQILWKLFYQMANKGLDSEILSFCKLQIQIKYIMDSLINVWDISGVGSNLGGRTLESSVFWHFQSPKDFVHFQNWGAALNHPQNNLLVSINPWGNDDDDESWVTDALVVFASYELSVLLVSYVSLVSLVSLEISYQLISWDYHYHCLSLLIIDYHWLSLIIIDYHWLLLIIIDYHWSSLTFIDYHW